MSEYPTKAKILTEPPPPNHNHWLQKVRQWKNEHWVTIRDKTEKNKREAIRQLVKSMTEGECSVRFDAPIEGDCYMPDKKMIRLNENPSIITTLHEISHFINGSSELKACRFSVWLFRDSFPLAYKKLRWEGHKLVKD
jgi:hypothetical protein